MKNYSWLAAAFLSILFSGCSKEFLDKKPDQHLIIPQTLGDFQSLFDNLDVMNVTSGLSIISGDEYYTVTDSWQNFATQTEKNGYVWAEDIYGNEPCTDWDVLYQQVFYSNVVLDGLGEGSDLSLKGNEMKGSALFYRSWAFFQLAQLFAPPYESSKAPHEQGLILRLSSDVNAAPARSTLQESYDRILADLRWSITLLPATTPSSNRPNKTAAYALMARIHQSMENYEDAGRYADSVLQLRSALIDYNNLDPASDRPFPSALPADNPEVIYSCRAVLYGFFFDALTSIDSNLYRSYGSNDLRKKLFFAGDGTGPVYFKGSYSGTIFSYYVFSGMATDEMYLIRAESYARAGYKVPALTDLNHLLTTRFQAGTFVPITASSAQEALTLILSERKKELVSRGMRWSDLRRLNNDPSYAVRLERLINNQQYSLEPGSNRYTLPLPATEIDPKVPQNIR